MPADERYHHAITRGLLLRDSQREPPQSLQKHGWEVSPEQGCRRFSQRRRLKPKFASSDSRRGRLTGFRGPSIGSRMASAPEPTFVRSRHLSPAEIHLRKCRSRVRRAPADEFPARTERRVRSIIIFRGARSCTARAYFPVPAGDARPSKIAKTQDSRDNLKVIKGPPTLAA